LGVEAVFGFIPHHRLRAINHASGDLFVAVGWQGWLDLRRIVI
jgi:hypothetical protein